jgi:hypothetical protein
MIYLMPMLGSKSAKDSTVYHLPIQSKLAVLLHVHDCVCRLFFFITEDTKSILEARKGNYQEIKTNAELKEALDSLEPVKNDSDSVAQVCEQFRLHSIDLPSWTRGRGEVVPLPRTDNSNPLSQMKIRFEQLKLEFIRSVPLYND